MNSAKKKRLEAAGFKVGPATELLQLSAQESALVNMRLSLAKAVRRRRLAQHASQQELASLIGSSQSRVAKLESGGKGITIDLMVRAMLATGAEPREVGRVLATAGR